MEAALFRQFGRRVWRGPSGIASVTAAIMISMRSLPEVTDPNMESLIEHILVHIYTSTQRFQTEWGELSLEVINVKYIGTEALVEENFWGVSRTSPPPTILFALSGYLGCRLIIYDDKGTQTLYKPLYTTSLEEVVLVEIHG